MDSDSSIFFCAELAMAGSTGLAQRFGLGTDLGSIARFHHFKEQICLTLKIALSLSEACGVEPNARHRLGLEPGLCVGTRREPLILIPPDSTDRPGG
jgi:hypothetical protein